NFNVTFTATLTNDGNENINSITCGDVPAASLTGVPGSLAVGASAVITGGSGKGRVGAKGNITGDGSRETKETPWTNESPETCTGTTNPSISVVKGNGTTPVVCVSTFNPATQNFSVTFTATLTNTGNENINSITCGDVPAASLTGVPSSLAVGASAVITG